MSRKDWIVSIYAGGTFGGVFWFALSIVTRWPPRLGMARPVVNDERASTLPVQPLLGLLFGGDLRCDLPRAVSLCVSDMGHPCLLSGSRRYWLPDLDIWQISTADHIQDASTTGLVQQRHWPFRIAHAPTRSHSKNPVSSGEPGDNAAALPCCTAYNDGHSDSGTYQATGVPNLFVQPVNRASDAATGHAFTLDIAMSQPALFSIRAR